MPTSTAPLRPRSRDHAMIARSMARASHGQRARNSSCVRLFHSIRAFLHASYLRLEHGLSHPSASRVTHDGLNQEGYLAEVKSQPLARLMPTLHRLRDTPQRDTPRIRKRLISIFADPTHGSAITADLRDDLSTLPSWMQFFLRDVIVERFNGLLDRQNGH